jgi:23S rRNA pseudouridine1911/1915/1917 synthase
VTLSERLRAVFPEASGRSLRQWLTSGRVRVNGAIARDGRVAVDAADAVTLGAPRPHVLFPAELGLVHEDDDLLVVDKPAGLLTIATERERERTAYRMVWTYLAGARPPRRPFIVHRLDRETSGLLVVAKAPAAKRHLQAQFEARTVERIYVALVEGRVAADRGTLSDRVVEDRSLRVRAVRGRAGRAGKEAITHYRVIGRRPDSTLLELTLGTGRRRQIRAQLAALGHPIVGDGEHGSQRGRGRLWLHAARLGFTHPATGAPVSFESAPPPALARRGSGV